MRVVKRFIPKCLGIQITALCLFCYMSGSVFAVEADLIVYNGKVVTVDSDFSICRAMAVKDNRILRVGGNKEILQLKGDDTKVVNLKGKRLLSSTAIFPRERAAIMSSNLQRRDSFTGIYRFSCTFVWSMYDRV